MPTNNKDDFTDFIVTPCCNSLFLFKQKRHAVGVYSDLKYTVNSAWDVLNSTTNIQKLVTVFFFLFFFQQRGVLCCIEYLISMMMNRKDTEKNGWFDDIVYYMYIGKVDILMSIGVAIDSRDSLSNYWAGMKLYVLPCPTRYLIRYFPN